MYCKCMPVPLICTYGEQNKINKLLLNLLGSTVLPRFLFQKRYVNDAACWLPVPVTLIVG